MASENDPLIDSIESIFEHGDDKPQDGSNTPKAHGIASTIDWDSPENFYEGGSEPCSCDVCRPKEIAGRTSSNSTASTTAENSSEECRKRKRLRLDAVANTNNPSQQEDVSVDGNAEEKPACQRRPWSQEEHERFLSALERFGAPSNLDQHHGFTVGLGHGVADMISFVVGTRTPAQVRSHAQKYFLKQQRQTQSKE
ncbi:hypothetical protein GUITHDRAFT_154578 [Guillardia theta CCMP2712]|uniref:HTH myb-type domain-containing protein n=1 Tax=Guillardia theta (strain CCMP2712) TaxID=905079 RepID=L1ISS7_GUITC|nr:hypothetical protein GUITHDRAFT_154578 [Guillardia theta CCMP2712]EKX38885.1 hypothetical protein GUITHDRAFT_154578 [Guillardia theta CCMP2712]|mmetsp:Transcript_32177/g.102459  ORF Transcript_32177/g.102459 Transcript_32177/m.102459 type:complete len:197 (-) Transcript_32177:193-783(-)|eukprot:XP_005825865.1 hypothetical protein GUITHDRAFT_154578 [Guillardia theta CCMP2712]